MSKTLTEMAAAIVTAQASNTTMTPEQIEDNLAKVFASLKRISEEEGATALAVSDQAIDRHIRQSHRSKASDPTASIREDRVICLECHKQFRHLTHTHLRNHGLTPASYRKKYGIPDKQPLMADTVRLKKHFKAIKSSAKHGTHGGSSEARAI